jgi:galactokinase/mevalonate kinase-like predicted kinase
LGAGGGGYFLFFVNQITKNQIKKKFKTYPLLNVKIHFNGTEIIYENK